MRAESGGLRAEAYWFFLTPHASRLKPHMPDGLFTLTSEVNFL